MTSNPAELVQRVRALDPAERVIAAVHLLDVLEEIDGVWSDTPDPGDPPGAAARSATYEELADAGAALPLAKRADLVWDLVRTLDEDWIAQNRAPIDPEWRADISRRLDDILLGRASGVDKPEALRLIKALLYLRTTGESVRSIAPATGDIGER